MRPIWQIVATAPDPLGESQRRTVGRHQIHPFRETVGSHLAATQVAQRLLRRQLAHGRRPAAQPREERQRMGRPENALEKLSHLHQLSQNV